ncbi:hypothetical protein RyT2_20610 [Pseudolactococcus yaeyamensis]
MVVGVKVDFLWFSIGTGDFFHSFFSTVCVNLEKGDWGSTFPIIMNDLYSGKIEVLNLEKAKKELEKLKEELQELSPKNVVWDAEDLDKMPPWGDNISDDITNLSNYFVTSDGRDLIDTLIEAVKQAIIENVALEIKAL